MAPPPQQPSLSSAGVVANESGFPRMLVYKVRGRTKPAATTRERRAPRSAKGATESDFVRSMPVSRDVIAAAKAKGIRMSANHHFTGIF